jgi:hypothetical protein
VAVDVPVEAGQVAVEVDVPVEVVQVAVVVTGAAVQAVEAHTAAGELVVGTAGELVVGTAAELVEVGPTEGRVDVEGVWDPDTRLRIRSTTIRTRSRGISFLHFRKALPRISKCSTR